MIDWALSTKGIAVIDNNFIFNTQSTTEVLSGRRRLKKKKAKKNKNKKRRRRNDCKLTDMGKRTSVD